MSKGASALPTGPSQAEPEGVSALRASVPCAADLLAAIGEVPDGWWWSLGTCSFSNDASIGPDVNRCDKETLLRFDNGLHADLGHPSTVAEALRDCIAQARGAGVTTPPARAIEAGTATTEGRGPKDESAVTK